MTVQVNGRPMELPENATVAELLARMGTGEQRVAVEVNRRLISRKEWAKQALQPEDRVEVVNFVGGG
jgi:sulfur carrier protein